MIGSRDHPTFCAASRLQALAHQLMLQAAVQCQVPTALSLCEPCPYLSLVRGRGVASSAHFGVAGQARQLAQAGSRLRTPLVSVGDRSAATSVVGYMSGQGASGSSSSAAGAQPTVKREQSVGSLSSLGSLGYDANNIMSGLQDDDLFNFVLVNADHIASGGDGTLAFMDDTAAVDAAAALPATDAAAAVAGDGNWLPTAVADAAAAGTAAGVASFQTASTVPPMPGSVAAAGVGAAAGAGVGAGAGSRKAGAVTRARGRGAGSLKRGTPGADRASAGAAASGTAIKPEKRRKRLEKNRESARECRRRKKEHLEVLEARVAKLESEAALLRERLRASRSESTKEEVEEKRQARKEMRERLAKGATDEELAGVIGAYVLFNRQSRWPRACCDVLACVGVLCGEQLS